MIFYKLMLVGLGGFLGSVARYLTARTIDDKLNATFPFGTLAVNIAGSFALGVIVVWAGRRFADPENLKLFLITGFCGGFTTFSAFAFESMNMLDQRMTGSALTYITVSVVLGVLAVIAGIAVGKQIG